MSKFSYFLSVAAILIFLSACSNKPKTREQQVAEFRSELTGEDTTQMLKICDDAMELLKNKQYDRVLASMFEYTDSTQEVKPLSAETMKRYKTMFKMFPVLEYHRTYYSFMLEGCNDVKYMVTFAPSEKTGTGEAARTSYMFNPVKVDGTWRLCVKTPDDQLDIEKR